MSEHTQSGSFLDELKRRKVYQATATYGAAVFVVWQAADIAFPALGLPPSLLRFVVIAALLGFPVAIGLSWTFEVVPQDAVDGRPSGPRSLARRPLLLTVGSVLLLGCVGWILLPGGAMALGDGAQVLVGDLKNETGETIFDGTLDEALRLSLVQSSRFSLLTPPRIRQGLGEMRRAEDAPLDERTAIELAVRLGVGAVVLPSLRRIGSQYVLEARLVEPATERTVASPTETASSPEGVLDALDRLARELRRELGETLGSMLRTPVQLRRATTVSLEALKAWSEGIRQSNAGRDQEASVLFRRAVELDSTFALAQAALGQWYRWNLNDPARADSAFDRALAHLEGVSERERLSILGTVAEWRGDREAAAVWFAALTELLPQDPVGWSRLGYVYLRLGRDEEAIGAYRRVVLIDSLNANAWANLATLHYGLGDLEAAVRLYERGFRLQPDLRTNPVLNEEYGHDLVLLGRFDEAEELYGLMLEGPPSKRARGLRSMALLRTYAGRYVEASDLLREAIVLHRAAGSAISEVRDRAFLTAAQLRLGRAEEATREIHAAVHVAVQNRVPPILLATLGVLGARNGQLKAAEELLDSATARSDGSIDDRAALEYLTGEVEVARGDPKLGLAHLEAAASLQGAGRTVRILSALAQARLAMGETEQAAALLEEAAGARGSDTSREDQEEWILAHYRLARLLQELGRTEDAQAAYERFLGLWSQADPELREVGEARSRLAELAPG